MLSAMLWAWLGVCGLSVVAAAVIVLAEVRLEQEDVARLDASARGGQVAAQVHDADAPLPREERADVE